MSWPPEGSKPPATPQAARPSPPASPGETDGETRVKPQAKPTTPTPPQFGHDGIDPVRALLILGLPLLAAAVAGLVLFASPLVWWIAAGVAAAGVAGGVVLRRSGKARGLLRRTPGAGRIASGLRRASNGRFARSPLGRVVNRALGRRPGASSGGSSGGSSSRPKSLSGRLRSMLPSWAGGTRPKRPGGPGGASPGGSSGGRMRSLLSRLKPGGGRRSTSPGASSGGRPGKPGGSSSGGAKTTSRSLLGRAARSVGKATGRASRAVGSKLFGTRPSASSSSSGGGSSKTKSKSKKKTSGGSDGSAVDVDAVLSGADKVGRLLGKGLLAIFEPLRGLRGLRWPKKRKHPLDDPSTTWEAGIEGTVINGKHVDPELGRIAERTARAKAARVAETAQRARKLAKKRAQQHATEASAPKPAGDTAGSPQETDRSSPAKRDHDPPPSPPVSPRSHREATGRKPHITSANTTHGGKTMAVETTKYNNLVTNAASRRQGWQDASDAFRRDANELDEKAKEHDAAAQVFRDTGNVAAAEEREEQARQLRDDANTCRTYASKMQEKANAEQPAA